MNSSSPQKARPAVIVLGDGALVAEYAEITAASGYEVLLQPNMKSLKALAERTAIALELTNINVASKKNNLVALDKALPATTAILSSSVNITVLDQSAWLAMKHRLIGVAALPTLIAHTVMEIAPSVHTLESTVAVARNFFASLKKEVTVVQDRVGMVLPRIICQIINEAMFAVQQDVASPKEIDVAMKLAVNYPLGPLEWGEKIGFAQVYAVLDALHRDLGEERYRICPLLKAIAATGKFWGE